jgi:hypothetical protein
MAIIVATSTAGFGRRTVIENTMTASDTFTYLLGSILILRNPTAGALSPVIDGSDGTVVGVAGLGSVSVASGFPVTSIAAGAIIAIPLDTIEKYLQGTITVTGGTGLKATLLTL